MVVARQWRDMCGLGDENASGPSEPKLALRGRGAGGLRCRLPGRARGGTTERISKMKEFFRLSWDLGRE